MRVEVYQIVHYGLDYIGSALRSVYDQVDAIHVVYSPHPSHGSRTNLPPPESREQLMAAALDVGPKVKWHDVNQFWTEGPHRDYALSLCRGDLALVVDADEVWEPAVLEAALKLHSDQRTSQSLEDYYLGQIQRLALKPHIIDLAPEGSEDYALVGLPVRPAPVAEPVEQLERFEAQRSGAAGNKEKEYEEHPVDMDFVHAISCGMPPTGGVGYGIDRLVMILADKLSIRDIIPFPMRMEKRE